MKRGPDEERAAPRTAATRPPRRARNGERDFRGQRRWNRTQRSTTDPEARLYRKGYSQPAKLCYLGHVLMENRNGLLVDAELTQVTGWAERAAAASIIATTAPSSGTPRGRQGLRHQGSRRHLARPRGHPARGAEPDQPLLGHRRMHHSLTGLCNQPTPPQARRGAVRLDEGDRQLPADQTPRTRPRGLDIHRPGSRLQPHSTAEPLGPDLKASTATKADLGQPAQSAMPHKLMRKAGKSALLTVDFRSLLNVDRGHGLAYIGAKG